MLNMENVFGSGLHAVLVLTAGLEMVRVSLLEDHLEVGSEPGDDWRIDVVNWLVLVCAVLPVLGTVLFFVLLLRAVVRGRRSSGVALTSGV